MEKSFINIDNSFVSNNQTPIITDPRKGSFNLPPLFVSSELSSILKFRFLSIFSVWTYKLYFAILQFLAQSIAIISPITNQTLRTAFRPPRTISGHLDLSKNFINQRYFVRGCRGNGASQRNTLAVDHHHPLRSFAPFGFSNPKAPFFAGAKLPSIKASSQSNRDCWSRSPKNLRQTLSQIPSSSQAFNLRQHVAGLGYRLGKSFHLAPVRKIHKMPSSTSLLLTGGLPTRPGLGLGKSGSILSHCSSFKNRVYSAIVSPPIAYYTKTLKMSRFLTY
jgi:hypothetical protein